MTVLNGEDEVVELCRDLIRIDSTNAGDNAGPGERAAAEYVAEKLAEVGLEPQILESDRGRANVIARIAGEDSSRDALLLHGHLDVVPFNPDDWTHHPLSGEIADDCVWGRGAVDMKNMDAMMLAVVRQRLSEGRRPPRDVVLAFTADEEAGGTYGAQWLADKHADLFEGCTEAISEVGGFSVSLDDARRLYLIQAAEKGIAWMRLTAKGRAGHGSMLNSENAITELAEAVGRIGRYEWPMRLTQTVTTFLTEISGALELELDLDDAEATVAKLGPLARMIGATLRNTANPTMLDGGYKANVIPQSATAHVDGRFLPGYEEEFFATIDELLGPNVSREFVYHDIAIETGFDGALVRSMTDALLAEDPGALAVPYTLSGGTDLKAFSRLGMRGFGFSPLRLPAGLDFSGMFHGVDERVPVDSLRFGVRVLDRFLDGS
ncbi:Acetylornithine deacetylase/Succinyl-diaminopimelate desuccinylase [Streptosporangium subroseum]|uniref:Acetylornithine deacetylase/Succinyl-diaminopimelate desuccinylase n=1 Tax=Streptosporangium subroseum TaxID=106412 RepID=A0A239IKX2_9ACTN|nr:M20/M25/M40 family metallo-hydrolase [Streptosporangium subroseum]SNS94181.1 Acetylornithine deacetylase/Succinyl-diaminopimelate desuccinylase [Streptosporangium subroseum]